ncbi:MAG TPA: hypothetical protein DCP53_06760 [Elusimicrobia bacterium]|nr:MAG: hypothetical protein A2551_08105 [Elusimicrobia bacterium RIFOXYD2_FULL_34_30]HAM39074.1 hypothetical protein [Elusimicrobiota bacterium]
MKINKKIYTKAKKIKLIASDIDGVLTDGKIIILENGEELKYWDVYDRFAYTLLRNYAKDIKLAWITGRNSKQVVARAKEVGIHYLYQGCMNKISAINEILQKEKFKIDEVAFIGDDLVDLSVLLRCGFSACPKNATIEVRKSVDYVTGVTSGQGVLREVVEIIFKSKGIWRNVLKQYRS